MIYVALLGFGTVGSGCAEVLTSNKDIISKNLGEEIKIKYILDLREFPDSPFANLIVHDFNTILNDDEVTVVAEMMGGAHPAFDFTKALLEKGKSVITSNKQVVSTFGVELLEIANKNNVRYLFEASVGGGIPLIRPMTNDLASNDITSIDGILNGTTNFILTKMKNECANFEDVLSEAQRLGYAEANPSADVDGLDAARKIVILAALACSKLFDPDKISCEGIRNVVPEDFEIASTFGYSIKLIAHYSKSEDGKIFIDVGPRFVPYSSPLSTVNDVFNAVMVSGNMLGDTMFYGKGAGKLPTASAICADIMDAAFSQHQKSKPLCWYKGKSDDISEIKEAKKCIIAKKDSLAASNLGKDSVCVGNYVASITKFAVSNDFEKSLGEGFVKSYIVM